MSEEKETHFMKRAQRKACWEAKDALWGCLDKVKGDADPSSVCKQARDLYEQMCPQSWVVHFDRKYHYEKFKIKLKTEGFSSADEQYQKKS